MNKPNRQQLGPIVILLGTMFFGPPAYADDAEDLAQLLHEFLAGAGEEAAHERFWAEDLVYTSSSGTRTTKAGIMKSFSESDQSAGEEPGLVYTAEDVRIKLYGTAAVVAFRLVATPRNQSGDDEILTYFNTGTFLKRDGTWQVVAWQATKIPGS